MYQRMGGLSVLFNGAFNGTAAGKLNSFSSTGLWACVGSSLDLS